MSLLRFCGFPYIVVRITRLNIKRHAQTPFIFLTRASNPAATLPLNAVLSQNRFYTALETSNTTVGMYICNDSQNGECCDENIYIHTYTHIYMYKAERSRIESQ